MRKITTQKGVTVYCDDYHSCDIYDIDIKPGIKSVTIPFNMYMDNLKKSFPDVEELVIKSCVTDIVMFNTLFPNVKRVTSESPWFVSGKYLISEKVDGNVLLNTFCRSEEIDLKDVSKLNRDAFFKCKSLNIKNTTKITSFNANAFDNSALMAQPFKNGVKMAGNLVIAIDDTAEEAVIPDDKEVCILAENIDLSNIRKLVIHNADTLIGCNNLTLPQCVVLDSSNDITKKQLQRLAHLWKNSAYIRQLKLTDKVKDFKEIDGVIYDKNIRELIVCSLENKIVEIPEGVKSIGENAFCSCKLKSVKLPNSLLDLGFQAFFNCKNLEFVDFGSGLSEIGPSAFAYCKRLKRVALPSQMRYIRRNAFSYSGLEFIKLNDGLRLIADSAFYSTHMNSIDIPESVEMVEVFALGSELEQPGIKSIKFGKFLPNCLFAFTYTCKPRGLDEEPIKVECNKKIVYVPKYRNSRTCGKLEERLKKYFTQDSEKTCELWNYAYSAKGKESAAIVEYEMFASNSAAIYLKKNARRIATRLIEEGNEEKTVKFFKFDFLSKASLNKLASKANELGQMTVQAYLLEQLKGESKQNFSL